MAAPIAASAAGSRARGNGEARWMSWSGLRPFVADGLPVVGEVPVHDNLFVATGHYRNGILLAPKTAQIVADKIVDNVESVYLRNFGLDRMAVRRAISSTS